MQDLVGIIRTEGELNEALVKLEDLKERAEQAGVEGNRQYNPGWHLAIDLHSLLTVSEATTRAATLRQESRGGHTREDYPKTDPEWGSVNVVVRQKDGAGMTISQEPLPQMPDDLKRLFEEK
jgi:succinate dehydrogenase / fumarate reductase flavoprotein subunit